MSTIGTRIGKPGHVTAFRSARAAADDQADVGRGAAHVEGDRVRDAALGGDALGRHDPRRRAREEDQRRVRRGFLDRRDPAGRAHHQRGREPRLRRRCAERREIPGREWAQIRVDSGGRRPLVLAELGSDFVRCDHDRARMPSAQLCSDCLLVRRVAEGEEQTHRDRLRVDLGQAREVERCDDAVRANALVHAEATLQRDERLGVVDVEAVEVRPVLAPEMQEVLEAPGCDERRPRALALQQRVRRDRRAVREPLERRRACCVENEPRRLDHRPLLLGAGRHLRRVQPAVREQHRVGKRPADVDPDDRHRRHSTRVRAPGHPQPVASAGASHAPYGRSAGSRRS